MTSDIDGLQMLPSDAQTPSIRCHGTCLSDTCVGNPTLWPQ